jgi:hypothetical protein
MIRCIQLGHSTYQGEALATWESGPKEWGVIRCNGRLLVGELTESRPAPKPRQARYDEAEIEEVRRWMAREAVLAGLAHG